MVSVCGQKKFCLSFVFFSLDQNPKIKICHMVASEHHEVIKGRWRLIYADALDSEEASEDGSIDNDVAALGE